MDNSELENVNSEHTPESGGEKPAASARGEVYDWLQCIVTALLVCVLVFVFIGRMIGVVGSSMVDTLHEGDRIIISNLFYTPKQGDIVVLRKETLRDDAIVKRVIAVAGQTVDIDFEKGIVYVDGVAIDEPYIYEPTFACEDFDGEVTVPDGCVFCMGDNRNGSTDSRDSRVGMIDTREILGRAILRVYPLNVFGTVD